MDFIEMTNEPDRTRLKRVRIPHGALLDVVRCYMPPATDVVMVTGENIPHDVEIDMIYWEPASYSLVLVLKHHSFPQVEPGAEIPYLDWAQKQYNVLPRKVFLKTFQVNEQN